MLRFVPTRGRLRVVLLWLLAAVVPLQCSAALVRASAGPAHRHVAVAAVALLDDMRRVGPSHAPDAARAAPNGVLAALVHGHGHGHAQAERHFHVGGEDGVLSLTADGAAIDRADAQGDGSAASSAAFAALLPLLASGIRWQDPAAAHRLPSSPAWAATSETGTPIERPPRASAA